MTQSELLAIVFSTCSTVIATLSLFISIFKIKKDNKYKRIETINRLIEETRKDDDFSFIFECIDRDLPFSYVKPGHFRITKKIKKRYGKSISSYEFGRKIDYILSIYDNFVYLKYSHLISNNEFSFFHYNLAMLFDNPHILNYLYSLNRFSKEHSIITPFINLIEYGKKNGYLKTDFDSQESTNYLYLIR